MNLEQAIEQINISQVLDSACNGALESIQEQLEILDIPENLREDVENEIFTNRICISR